MITIVNKQNKIVIKKPYLSCSKKSAKLCADICVNNFHETLWYEVPLQFKKYFVLEQADAFVVSFLYTALSLGYDIQSEAPISYNLFYQLTNHLIPVLAKNLDCDPIKIKAKKSTLNFVGKHIGTAYSAGVDSFFTIHEHTEPQVSKSNSSYRPILDTFTTINVGIFYSKTAVKDFENSYKQVKSLAADFKLNSLYINSNIHTILKDNYLTVNTIRIMAAVLTLQKYFKTYLIASSMALFECNTKIKIYADFDLLNTQYLSTESTCFVSSGGNKTRIDKLKTLVEYPICYNKLHPCLNLKKTNCNKCIKCIRDAVVLLALDKLHLFNEVFDEEFIKKNLNFLLAHLIAKSWPFTLEKQALDFYIRTGNTVPPICYRMAEQFTKARKNLLND